MTAHIPPTMSRTRSRMTEGRKVGGPKESGMTGGERASRGVRAVRAYHTIRQHTVSGLLGSVGYRACGRERAEGLLKL